MPTIWIVFELWQAETSKTKKDDTERDETHQEPKNSLPQNTLRYLSGGYFTLAYSMKHPYLLI